MPRPFPRPFKILTLILALLLGAAPAAAAQSVAGPTRQAASIGVRAAPAADASAYSTAAATRAAALRNSEKLMILGGATLIVGAIIGDTPGTIIMVGGAAIGLYGLYLFLDRPHSDRLVVEYRTKI